MSHEVVHVHSSMASGSLAEGAEILNTDQEIDFKVFYDEQFSGAPEYSCQLREAFDSLDINVKVST